MTTTCDVLVIGGGPAGSTAAALLARQGRRVVMVEKAHHPRFHIGESLLPANVALFDQLGIREEVERIGMPKWGIEFVSPDHAHQSFLEFGDAWDKSMPYSWQVRRSELDELMFRHAGRCGAETLEGCRIRNVEFDAEGAHVIGRCDDGSERHWRAAFVVDASGRDTLLASQMGAKRKMPEHNSAALFAHYTGVQRLPGKKEGNITIFWFQHGWFWMIPLADGTTSIGAVCWPHYLKTRDKPLQEFFADTVALCPQLQARLANAQMVDNAVHATGNYSYRSTLCSGDRFLLVGDAYTFVDPVFSSGVYLAMQGAFEAVNVIAARLDRPAEAPRARRAYEAMMTKGPREFCWFIFRVTNPTIRNLFMHPANPWRVKEAVLSLLAGDIYGKTPIWRSLRMFRVIYYVSQLLNLPRAFRTWRQRRANIRDVGALRGENVLDAAS
ncbi:NAD(P)/FAD-dependent oxidoreductase [Ideonella sp. DXS29W]|uniref:NAD(P)/FAD-dependent oxidoreductase n=1 Tax=Ideonella lacteola TaxID=2984193 RepID=A0ABU9BRL3_9BURK